MHRIEKCANVEASQQRYSRIEMIVRSNADDIIALHAMALQP